MSNHESSSSKTKEPPRKRSKASRACDECRRKKIRCDAILDMTTNKVVKICTTCDRNGDLCTFTRVPLKRGPTKGYSKSHSHPDDGKNYKHRNSSVSSSTANFPHAFPALIPLTGSVGGQPPSQPFPPSGFRQQVILPPLNSLSSQQGTILPPLQSPNDNRQRSNSVNSNSSQQSQSSTVGPQGVVFWKVPYEMPHISSSNSISSGSGGGSGGVMHHRSGSIDSVSSSISGTFTMNNSKLINSPQQHAPSSRGGSGIESMVTSDSESEADFPRMGSSSNNNPISSRPSSTVLSGMLNPMANSPRTSSGPGQFPLICFFYK
ncbi:unnamed protein product [Ambrosiozyma monospora]|uniref:Unnamed protein product n=1 Tax=Ambrosiozyma monospora TaxID=43982 RepID=A0ACB5U6D9_AMBMO|nr:unnamed protein product [Ambrosiozyma monospora]